MLDEYERELVKEVLAEVRKSKATLDYAFERMEGLAARLLEHCKPEDIKAAEPREEKGGVGA
jgi:hypothetical protein